MMALGSTVKAFAPATVANVGCGFDIFGFAIEGRGDTVRATRIETPGVQLLEIHGDGGRLPVSAESNAAGASANAVLRESGIPGGVELTLHKGLPLSSGLGSSAASSVAGALAVHHLFGTSLSLRDLLRCAAEGERAACGTGHCDNAAPSLLGGFVLVRDNFEFTPLPVPSGLTCALVRPHLEIDTGLARSQMPESVALPDAVRQWGNVAALVSALYQGDLDLLASALEDRVATPVRSRGIPGFEAACEAARGAGALGCGISGSGPSLFALCESMECADRVSRVMEEALESAAHLRCDRIVSPVGAQGAAVSMEPSA